MKYATAATYPMNMYGRFPEQHRPPERLPKHTRLDRPARASSNAKAMRQRAMEGRVRDRRAATQQRKVQESSGTLALQHNGGLTHIAIQAAAPASCRRRRGRTENQFHCAAVKEVKHLLTSAKKSFLFSFFLSQDKRSLKGKTHLQDRRSRHCASQQTCQANNRGEVQADWRSAPFCRSFLFFISFSARVERSRRDAMAIAETPSEQARDCYARSGWGKPAAQRDVIAEPDGPRQQRVFVGRK